MAHRESGESASARPAPRRTASEPSVPRRYAALFGAAALPGLREEQQLPVVREIRDPRRVEPRQIAIASSPRSLRDHDRAVVGMRDHEASVGRGVPHRGVAGHPRDRARGAAGSHRAQRAKQRPFVRRRVQDLVAPPGQAVDVQVFGRQRRHGARLIDDRDSPISEPVCGSGRTPRACRRARSARSRDRCPPRRRVRPGPFQSDTPAGRARPRGAQSPGPTRRATSRRTSRPRPSDAAHRRQSARAPACRR